MYRIVTDGSCDLSPELVKKLDVDVVPFYVSQNGNDQHKKEIVELPIREFYDFMVENPKVFPKTSMPAIQDYIETFEPIIKKGEDIICICITTKFSGSYNSANSAKDIILDDYPNARITVIDATVNTVLQGQLVEQATLARDAGKSYEEVIDFINEIKPTGRIFFTVGSMDYLIHGGRVGKLSGIAAGALNIKPLIVLKEGEIFSEGLTRGRKKSLKKVLAMIHNYYTENQLNADDYTILVGFGYDKEEAEVFKKAVQVLMEDIQPGYHQPIDIRQIGATIAVHTGPYPLGVGIIKRFK